jgi:tripartite-type tricarboxylate transporter receptor subunit TctC
MMLSIAVGQTMFGFADPPIVVPLAQSGKIRALAMTGPNRLPELPDVPTVAEAWFHREIAALDIVVERSTRSCRRCKTRRR